MTRFTTGNCLGGLVLCLVLLSLAFSFPAETVDFSKIPDQGLKFKVSESMKFKMEGTVTAGEQELSMTQNMSGKQIYTQTYVKVKDGKILEIEREYEDAVQKMVVENDMMSEPHEQEMPNPLAWKHIRAKWNDDDEFTLEVKEEDAWKEAEDNIKARLNAKKVLQPNIPLPKGEKKVGDTWKLSAEELKSYFADSVKSVEDTEVDIEGTAEFELAEITEIKGVKCAVIKFKFNLTMKMGDNPSPKIDMSGLIHYSIDHKVFYGMKGKGTVKVEGEMEQMGQDISMDLTGPIEMEVKVKVLAVQ